MKKLHYFISFLLISVFISVFIGLTFEDPRESKTQTTDNQSNVITPVHVSYGTPIFTDNFDTANDTTSLKARGYKPYYRGTGVQGFDATWWQPTPAPPFPAFNGPTSGYVAANYSVVTGVNNIDSWLVLPRVTGGLLAGDSLYFYQRSKTGSTYPDSIRVMYSVNDSVPEGVWTELGRFKTNTTTGWERMGFKAPTASANGRFAIRYCVANGGPSGTNSDYIGIDAITIERTAAPTVPQYYNFNTTIGSNAFPFSVVAGKLTQFLVLPGELNQPTPAPSGTITKFYIFCATASITYTNLTIKFGQSTITTLPTGVFYTDPMDTVYFNPSVTLNSTMGTFTPITLSRPYVYDNTKSLIIEISQCGASATGMSTYHTSFTGSNRRTYNQTAGGCNYIYQSQGSTLMHCGIDVTAGPVAALPDLIYYKFKNNPSPSLTPNFAIPGVGTNPAPLTTLTLTTPGQFDSCLSGTATASAKIVTGYSLSTGTSSFTISMWLNNLVTPPASTRYLFGDAGLQFRCFVGGVAPANGAIFRGTGITDVPIRNIFPGPTVIHIVYDSASSNVKVYKNGILDTTVAQTAFNFTTGTGFSVGGYSSSAGLEGLMDEFRFYKRALGQAEVTATWNQNLGIVTGIAPISTQIPDNYSLSQNYPNPFNPTTRINFALQKSGLITLKIYDVLGREVKVLVNEVKNAGSYSVDFNASALSSGMYFYRLEVNGFKDTKKLVLIK